MAPSKRFKLKLSLPTFQFCRTKATPPPLPKLPSESTALFSPINPKSFEISYPSFSDPPPTPARPLKIMPVSFNTKHCPSRSQKIYNSPVAYNSDDSFAWPMIPPPKGDEKGKKHRTNKTKKSKVSSVSSGESGWFSSDEDGNESLISSSENFDTSCDFGNIPITSKNGISKIKDNERNGDEESLVKKSSTSSLFRQLKTSCAVNDESYAVVKNSKNPYEDFKSSMMEMIMEKQMHEAKDLEQLLQCFLSLNSRHHHGAIIQAFSEIWHLLFM